MQYLIFALASVIYGCYGWLCYNPDFKHKNMIWLGLFFAVGANLLWILLSKNTDKKETLFFYALVWDSIVVISSIGVPMLLFGLRLQPIGWMGLIMLLSGLTLVKLST